MEKTLYSTCMQHDMPPSLLVFAVSFTPERLILGRSVEFRTPLRNFQFFKKKLSFNCVYAHI